MYSFLLKPNQVWQVWPEETSLLQFLDAGFGISIVEMTIASLMKDVRSAMTAVEQRIDNEWTVFSEYLELLKTELSAYNASTAVDSNFVLYANSVHNRKIVFFANGLIWSRI